MWNFKKKSSTLKTEELPYRKSDSEVVQEILDGHWGTGAVRKERLRKAGYNPDLLVALAEKLRSEKHGK